MDTPSEWLMGKRKIEPGTIAWRQGVFWITMPPPYDKRYYNKEAPEGAYKFATGEDSAYKTIQIIGGMPGKDILDIDIGIAIVDIKRKGKELSIHFKRDEEDVYKGEDVKEKVMTFKRANVGLKYHTDETGKLIIDEEPKRKTRESILAEELLPRLPKREKVVKEKELASVGDRYYLGHKLPASNVRVNL